MQIRAKRNDDTSKSCDLNSTAFHGTGEKQSGSGQLQQDKVQGAMFLNLVKDTNRTYYIYQEFCPIQCALLLQYFNVIWLNETAPPTT